ncbi:MAG: hypothetical protein DRP01_09710 [Archaeoglobales archaeon]|nr:MAG: hypothetical protein DRP01_09710 [Archaeoglobales archaeon]
MKLVIKDKKNLKKWGVNLLKFTAPALSVFFGLLQQEVPFKQASWVLLLALYGAISDYLKKLK